jgi:uncharacterized membrane protein YdbT with pleckstrin-like domain
MMLIAIVGLGLVGSKHSTSGGNGFLSFLISLDFLGALFGLVRAYVFLKNAEYAVTDRRVIGKYGFIKRSAVDVLIAQVSGVTITQSIPGRIFGFGRVWILASGARRELIYVKDPLKFQKAVYARLEESRLLKGTAAYTLDVRMAPNDPATPTPAPPPPPPAPPGPPQTTPAQWAADPYGKSTWRYWDGLRWTGDVSSENLPPDAALKVT